MCYLRPYILKTIPSIPSMARHFCVIPKHRDTMLIMIIVNLERFYQSMNIFVSLITEASVGKESACCVGDLASIPGSGRSPGEGNGNPFQYSCLEKSMDRGAWQATVCGITKSRTQLSAYHFHFQISWKMWTRPWLVHYFNVVFYNCH